MQPEPMSQGEMQMRELDARIVDALERAPQVHIPAGFAARVAAHVPARPRSSIYLRARIKPSRYGVGAAAAGLLLLAIAMLVFAPRVEIHGVFWKLMEWTFSAQFCVLAAWLALWRRGIE